jgi:hypothetical protein
MLNEAGIKAVLDRICVTRLDKSMLLTFDGQHFVYPEKYVFPWFYESIAFGICSSMGIPQHTFVPIIQEMLKPGAKFSESAYKGKS